jgi:hypothetical protein
MGDEFHHDLALLKVESQWGLPIIRREVHELDKIELVPYHARSHYGCFLHFFIDDSHFSGMWRHPERSLNKVKKCGGALTPDFSLPWDWPFVDQLWNTRRNRFFGAYWQYYHIPVIPTVSWSDEKSYSFCFCGIEPRGSVAIGTLGVHKNANATQLFLQGYAKMREILHPVNILCYGRPVETMDMTHVTVVTPFDAKFDHANIAA